MKVGFIGIGQMGRHMARRILEAGNELVVNDLDRGAAAALISKGAVWASSPREVAEACRVVFSSLPTPQVVENVVYAENGLSKGWRPGDIYVDMSTNSPTLIKKIARDASSQGVSVLDAPVSGGTRGAELGTLAIMVGGEAEPLEKVRQLLLAMGQKIFPVGQAGCGNVAKLVNNLISLTTNAVTAEGFVLGVKAGIDPKTLWEIVRVSTGACWSLEQMPATIFKGDFEPGFKLSLGRKDMGLALTLGQENGVPMTIGKAVQSMMDSAMEGGFAEKSVQAVVFQLEDKAGVKVRAP